MNQVQEMPRLFKLDRLPEAVERLNVVTGMMGQQPGFLGAEVLQNVAQPQTLLVLHAWRDLADWNAFSSSQAKQEFMAGRPEGLYDMLDCGLNWRSLQADGAREGSLLRREIIRRPDVDLRRGQGVLGCQTFVYQDGLPAFAGCTLRLTRIDPSRAADTPDPDAIADETYGQLFSVPAPAAQPSVASAGA
jgi:heme-degrading monooxygenase HmoA